MGLTPDKAANLRAMHLAPLVQIEHKIMQTKINLYSTITCYRKRLRLYFCGVVGAKCLPVGQIRTFLSSCKYGARREYKNNSKELGETNTCMKSSQGH